MPLMALTCAATPSPPFSRPNLRRSTAAPTAVAASTSSSEAPPPPQEFRYSRADPSVRWPNFKLEDYPPPSQSPFPDLPPSPKPQETLDPAETLDPPDVPETLEPLDSKHSRTRAKKMTKLALKRARDWRHRVQLLTDRILSLPTSSLVADALDSSPVQMTPTDYCFLVKSLARSSWPRALEVFEYLTLRRSHAPGPRMLATIIAVLGRARQDALADEIFRRALDPDAPESASVQVYNAMMGVHARSGRFAAVQDLLSLMRSRGIEPDLVSFNTLINARTKAGGQFPPGSAVELLAEVRRSGLRPDTVTYNTLISACSHVPSLAEAVRVFDDMAASRCEPDLWTYNAMVSVYGRCGRTVEAELVFQELGKKGFSPDAVTYNSLLYAFAREGDTERVGKVCEEMMAAGFSKDEITYNTIIHMYGKQGKLDLALQVYDEMKSAGCTPDAVTYTVLVDSLGKASRICEAEKMMAEMVDAGVRPTLRTFSALICGYAKAGMRVQAEDTFDRMVRSGIKPDRFAYSVVLDTLLRSNETRKAMVLYRDMLRDGFYPDQGLYQVMLGVLTKGNRDEDIILEVIKDMEVVCGMKPNEISLLLIKGECFANAAEMLKRAVLEGYELDQQNLFSLLNAYAALNKHAEAYALLEFVKEHSAVSHSSINEASIVLLCKDHRVEAAMEEYNKMGIFGIGYCTGSFILYETLITCCSDYGFLCEASQLFSDMRFIGLQPSQVIYESMIRIYCQLGYPETVHHLIDQARNIGVSFDDLSIYVNLIDTYGKLKLWQKAEMFVGKLRLHQAVDRKIWNALISAYADNGRYEQARAVFNTMIKNGPPPTVDSVNGLMRALVVDGRLNELYVVVQELQDMDFKISKSTILIMLDAFARDGNIFEVKKIYHGMKAAGYLPTMHLYRSIIGLMSRGKRVRDVEMMVSEMEEAGFKPDITIFNSLLKMYTGINDFRNTLEVYQSIRAAGLNADEDTYNTLIVMYSRDVKPEEGFALLSEMRKQGMEPKLDTYKSLLAACAKVQLWEQAEVLFESLHSEGHRLDRSFYHIMMKIYRDSGNHSKAEHLLSTMKDSGVEPTIATMHMLMVSYGTARQPQDAENVLKNLKTSGLDLSTLPYSSVINAYLNNGDYNLAITKLSEMRTDGVEPDHRIWTCFIRAASFCEQTGDTMLLLNSLNDIGFNLPIRLLTERTDVLVMDVDNLLQGLASEEDNASFNLVNALEDLLWAFERRATASWLFQLAIKRNIYRHDVFRVAEKDWGADFRKLSGGAALVGLTLWLDHMQDASLHGSPESSKTVVLITGTAEYNMVSLNNTIKAYLWEMGSPFLPCNTRSGILVAKAHSLRMWLKDSSFCMDLELKDSPFLPKSNSMKLTEGYFMRAGLVPAFKEIHERLGQVRPKKFARLALLSEDKRQKVITTDIKGRSEKLEKLKKRGTIRARMPTRLRSGRFMRRLHKTHAEQSGLKPNTESSGSRRD